VFAGGIGENAAIVRARICNGLDFLGIALDPQRNAQNEPLSSPDSERVQVRIMRTNEALMIARSAMTVLKLGVP
jgi:acetate kinase